ncbi:unnamed protein product [Triticum turgidum subsp. durum]|uniref:4-hydroxy-7-methoxy-3-oxo-3,4-dihydro-2H-1,4-benzoxazin-2-yl glucosidebeta-D-glucosidase n=1 Tax=Triticum turgidum subsp. durum TaxID=4567 RepID=A0A9R0XBR0_TRITD|nr:unnamed protein product [Triticum turgidum subsp. durum]
MGKRQVLPALLLALLALASSGGGAHASAGGGPHPATPVKAPFSRHSFPKGFVFGTGSAAYQYEGAVKEGGRGPTVWDKFAHTPGKIADGGNGDVALDFYHRYKEDLKLVLDMNMDAFRFSIAWSRILPTGSMSGGVNKEGIAFYNRLINEVIAKGLKPYVTLHHWDTPLGLEDKYGGFLSEKIVKDYVDFSDVCYNEFGDRVKHWTTFNEPWTYSTYGYATGVFAPGRCSPHVSASCGAGDSAREPYIVTHNILLAHAATVELYRRKYQKAQGGEVGITLVCHWYLPYTNSTADKEAAKRRVEFMLGWFMDPIVHGDYPASMRSWLGARLPSFTPKQKAMLKGSYDFFVYPPGIHELMLYAKRKYGNPAIYVMENGIDEGNNSSLPIREALKDPARINYHYKHLLFLNLAIKQKVNIKGYFSWTFMDCFEWGDGYKDRFGLIYIDRNTLKRYPKESSKWMGRFLKK